MAFSEPTLKTLTESLDGGKISVTLKVPEECVLDTIPNAIYSVRIPAITNSYDLMVKKVRVKIIQVSGNGIWGDKILLEKWRTPYGGYNYFQPGQNVTVDNEHDASKLLQAKLNDPNNVRYANIYIQVEIERNNIFGLPETLTYKTNGQLHVSLVQDDSYEENDSFSSAYGFGSGNHNVHNLISNDVDYYSIRSIRQ